MGSHWGGYWGEGELEDQGRREDLDEDNTCRRMQDTLHTVYQRRSLHGSLVMQKADGG